MWLRQFERQKQVEPEVYCMFILGKKGNNEGHESNANRGKKKKERKTSNVKSHLFKDKLS